MKQINSVELEYLESIAQDTKKQFFYNKHAGTWAWGNRGDNEIVATGFETRFQALVDSVEPYVDGELLAKYTE